jgi:hypothetical protein
MVKRIVYLTFYFEPDLCAGSFRNSPLAKELAKQALTKDAIVEVYTTMPNRYGSYDAKTTKHEVNNNLIIHRIDLPKHKSGMLDQIRSFWVYFSKVLKMNKGKKADLVFASSSRLFTAYLGAILANKNKSMLYLDIRDIFVDTIQDVIGSKFLRLLILPVLKKIEKSIFSRANHINLISPGFFPYFKEFKKVNYTEFTNGIDEEFLTYKSSKIFTEKKIIVYAGNIGDGQGLHKIIPQTAELVGEEFQFIIIGDGGARIVLEKELLKLNLKNVIILNPVTRIDLFKYYDRADFLFIHLNDYPAFEKVLPSKIFELSTFNKTILAGVSGYSAEFISKELSNSFVFKPCDINSLSKYLKNYVIPSNVDRSEFVSRYRRDLINKNMSSSILNYI